MKKNFLYMALGLMGMMGALSIGVADATTYSVIRPNVSEDTVTVTYNANNGAFSDNSTTKSVEYTKIANNLYMASENVQAPDRDGYMFAGWYLQQGDATSQTTEWYGIQTDTTETTKTVYAKWLPYTNKTVDLGEIGSFDIMDRNMGAEAVSDGAYNNPTANQLGYYYQWGNNYGFKNSGSVPYSGTTQIDITGKGYGPGNYYSSATFVKYGGKWDTDTSSTTYTSYGNLNLWGGENTSNPDSWRQGPCPENYHVPDTLEWKAAYELFKSWANTTAGQEYCATFTDDNTTYRPKCFASKLALPFAGYRYLNDSNVRYQGTYGYYWSSSPLPSNADYSYRLFFYSSNVTPQDSSYRAYGQSVRCFKNSSTQALTFSRNGEIIDTKNVRRWEPITTSYKPANPSGTTENWYTDSGLTSQFTFGNTTYVTEAKTLYSKITCNNSSYILSGTECVPPKNIVTFDFITNSGSGATLGSVEVISGDTLILSLYTGTKAGWDFVGWSETSGTTGVLTSNPKIIENKTLYAVFSKDLTATYLSGVGVDSIGANSGDCKIYNNETSCTVKAPAITLKDGYGTGKWSTGSNEVNPGSDITLTVDDTYTASATPNTYSVKFEAGEGTGTMANQNFTYDVTGALTANAFTRTGYTFSGWIYGTTGYTDGQEVSNLTTINNDIITFMAQWTPITYKINFSGNATNVSGTQTPINAEYDSGDIAPESSFTLTGYTFTGWNTESDGSETGYATGAELKNLTATGGDVVTLYAQRKANTYIVTFDVNGGNALTPNTGAVTYDTGYGTLPTPSRNGYSFNGWFTAATNGTKITGTTVVSATGDHTLYAQWTQNQPSGGSSSGGGSSGGGGSSKAKTSSDSVKSTETQTGSKVDSSTKATDNEDNTQDSSAKASEGQNQGKTYSEEFQQAYEFAYKHGITTMPTIEQANMEGPLTRIAMAKMLSYYAINVLGLKPDETRVNKFNDVSDKMDAEYNNAVILAYQLGIMGINMPNNKFRPNDLVTRGEFATALSRMLYKIADGKDKYYSTHLAKLMEEKIITNDNPDLQELRGYVMIMLMRSAK